MASAEWARMSDEDKGLKQKALKQSTRLTRANLQAAPRRATRRRVALWNGGAARGPVRMGHSGWDRLLAKTAAQVQSCALLLRCA